MLAVVTRFEQVQLSDAHLSGQLPCQVTIEVWLYLNQSINQSRTLLQCLGCVTFTANW